MGSFFFLILTKHMKKNKKLYVNLGLLSFFIWLLIFSYNSSKRKPENVSDLLNDFSWLHQWPKWLDLPLMNISTLFLKS